jgi:hypothetical protein
MVVGPFIFVL